MTGFFCCIKIADVPTISQTRNLLMLEAPKQHELSYNIKPLPPIPSSSPGSEHERTKRVTSAPAKTQDINDVSSDRDELRSFDVDRPTKTEGQVSCVDDSSFVTPRQNVVSPEERVFLTQVGTAVDISQ